MKNQLRRRVFLAALLMACVAHAATAAPIVNQITPPTGSTQGGATITLRGSNFDSAGTTQVLFGGVAATNVQVFSGGYLGPRVTCTIPAHAVGTVDVKVINPDASSVTISDGFGYVGPRIESLDPPSGAIAGSNLIVIRGEGFTPLGTTTVDFGANAATEVSVDDTGDRLVLITPPGSAGDVTVTLTNPDSTTATSNFTYTPMLIDHISPDTGTTSGGGIVYIEGEGFSSRDLSVTFGGVPATEIAVFSSTTIQCVAPVHAAGAVDVVVTNPNNDTVTAANGFTYQVSTPTVSRVYPDAGPPAGGITVLLQGAEFQSEGTTQVLFDGIPATDVQVTTAGYSSQRILCTAPAHALGAVDVTVINPDGGTVTVTDGFSYAGPNIDSQFPDTGAVAGNNTVTFNGTGFDPAGLTTVDFGGHPATDVSVRADGTQVSCVSPAGVVGPVTVTITNPDASTATSSFTYRALTITSVQPPVGLTSGNAPAEIHGEGFSSSGVVVTFGGVAANNVSTHGDETIYCYTPAHAIGAVDVVVRNPNNDTATAAGAYSYVVNVPVLISVNPTVGPAAGGIDGEIRGWQLESAGTTQVLFGGVPATNVQVLTAGYSAQRIAFRLPAHAPGVVDVTVISPGGGQATLSNAFTYLSDGTETNAVQPSSNPPFIEEGRSLTLTAPPGVSHQWRKDGVDMADDPPRITGTNTRYLVFTPVSQADDGAYTCVYDDGTNKAIIETTPFYLAVLAVGALPVTQHGGMVFLLTGLAIAGSLVIIRRRKQRPTH